MKTKRRTPAPPGNHKRSRKTLDLAQQEDEDLHSSSEEEEPLLQDDNSSDSEEEEEEPPDLKRVRLARQYLAQLDAQEDDRDGDSSSADESDDDDADHLSRKLQRERLQREGQYERFLADRVGRHVAFLQHEMVRKRPALLPAAAQAKAWIEAGHVQGLTAAAHDGTPTSLALSRNHGNKSKGKVLAVSASKDHSVVVWDVVARKRLYTLNPRWKKKKQTTRPSTQQQQQQQSSNTTTADRNLGQVLAVAISDDARWVTVGKRDGIVYLYDLHSAKPESVVQKFAGHKAAVTALTFRAHSHHWFSASEDRCLRHYGDDHLYMETLYGHQSAVTALDCYAKDRPVSVGRDRTARTWKLAEDTHLIYRGGSQVEAAECCAIVKDDWFVTGHQDGHLCLWTAAKKKAVAVIREAHKDGIVSVAAVPYSDLVATGSCDGHLRLWKVRTGATLDDRGIEAVASIPVRGYINGLQIDAKAHCVWAAVGQEHRLGRWNRLAGVKNRIFVIALFSPDCVDEKENKETEAQEEKSSDDDDSE